MISVASDLAALQREVLDVYFGAGEVYYQDFGGADGVSGFARFERACSSFPIAGRWADVPASQQVLWPERFLLADTGVKVACEAFEAEKLRLGEPDNTSRLWFQFAEDMFTLLTPDYQRFDAAGLKDLHELEDEVTAIAEAAQP